VTPIACESRIERVVVYARGAVVTRAITLPEALPEGPFELRVGGITAIAEPGSVRAIAEGHREVTALRARVEVPAAPAAPGALVERLRALDLARRRLEDEQTNLSEQRTGLGSLELDPGLHRWSRDLDAAARVGDALAVHGLLGAEVERLDGLLRASAEALEENARAREVAAIAAAQGTHGELAGKATPQLEVLIRLGAGVAVTALAVEYVVRPARWWPAYTARFTAAATRVALGIDAFVAQASGEDWAAVRLSLSTADLAQDARLPELRSLRFGRAQPPAKRGYRPPPPGLDAMFEGYDRTAVQRPPPPPDLTPWIGQSDELASTQRMTLAPHGGGPSSDSRVEKKREAVHHLGEDDEVLDRLAASAADIPLPQFSPPRQSMSVKAVARSAGALAGMLAAPSRAAPSGYAAEAGGGGAFGAPPPEPEPQAIEPGEAWLDFDTLFLPEDRPRAVRDASDPPRRGRLARDAGPSSRGGADVEQLAGPPQTSDPQSAGVRGRFDHRYDAEGTADVPSSGRSHRVAVTTAEAPSTPRFVAVPREVAQVFREAEIQNPFAGPLLSGPVDVFLDGALLTTTPIAFVDRAGLIHLGLGVEERIRIARNARVEEGTAGLLGSSAVVDHAVTVDLTSSLGTKVTVEVLERVPVSDEKDVVIKVTYARPEPEHVTQADRGEPLRKGLRFTVEVPAGAKARVELGYRVTLPSKNEIVGGNRRE
jgi:hypothetical protein